MREQSSSRSPVSRCRARATVSLCPTNYYASPPWYIACFVAAPPQQLDGTDLVAASAARAEELQARWATPPPYAPDARPVRALRPAPAAPRTRARPLGPFGSINGCCWRWTDTWSWLDTSAPWRPRDGSTQLPRWPEAKCCQNSRERLPFSLQHHHHRHNSNKTAISTTHPWPRTGMTRWSKTKREL